MSMIIKDETAGLVVFTIDNNGNMAFGDGTPISMLTLDGFGIIDTNGVITHGLGSSGAQPASGSGNLVWNQSLTITTVAGRIPNVQVDTREAQNYQLLQSQDGGSFFEQQSPSLGTPQAEPRVAVGSFQLLQNDSADGPLTDPTSQYYDANITTPSQNNTVAWRWI
jgi:hypothetical protein